MVTWAASKQRFSDLGHSLCRRSNHPPFSRVCWDSMRVQQLLSFIGMEVARIRTPGLPTRFSTLFSCNREEGGVYSVFRTRDGSYSFDRLLWTCTLFKLCFLLLVLLLLCCKYFDTFPRPGMYQNFVVMWIITIFYVEINLFHSFPTALKPLYPTWN